MQAEPRRDAAGVLHAPPLQRIDAEMTSWYGSRAIRGLAWLRDLRRVSADGA